MVLTCEKKQKIAEVVIEILDSRFQKFPENTPSNRNAPFHEAFLHAFSDRIKDKLTLDVPSFIGLTSWNHGLNTVLGQKFFESVAHILSGGCKKSFTEYKKNRLEITQNQQNKIKTIMDNLSFKKNKPNVNKENKKIFIDDDTSKKVSARNFTADVFVEYKNNKVEKITCIELKGVRPNSGQMRGEKEKILYAKAALFTNYHKDNKDIKIEYYMGFPFDPVNKPNEPNSSAKKTYMQKNINMEEYFSSDEILLSSELWDFLSGEKGTMEEILSIIRNIATPDFLKNLEFLKDKSNKNDSLQDYRSLLNKWYLKSEVELLDSDENILANINHNEKLIGIYNQPIFKEKAKYNKYRYDRLSALISK